MTVNGEMSEWWSADTPALHHSTKTDDCNKIAFRLFDENLFKLVSHFTSISLYIMNTDKQFCNIHYKSAKGGDSCGPNKKGNYSSIASSRK